MSFSSLAGLFGRRGFCIAHSCKASENARLCVNGLIMPIGKKSLLLFSPFGAICAPRGKTPHPTKPLWHWRAKLNGAKEREKISVSSAQKRASSSNKHQSTAEWVSFFGCPFSMLCQRVVWGMNGLLQWRLRRRVRGNEFFSSSLLRFWSERRMESRGRSSIYYLPLFFAT